LPLARPPHVATHLTAVVPTGSETVASVQFELGREVLKLLCCVPEIAHPVDVKSPRPTRL
jgi:hypothetical protein